MDELLEGLVERSIANVEGRSETFQAVVGGSFGRVDKSRLEGCGNVLLSIPGILQVEYLALLRRFSVALLSSSILAEAAPSPPAYYPG